MSRFKPFAVVPLVESALYDHPMIVIYPSSSSAELYPSLSRRDMALYPSGYAPILIQPDQWKDMDISRHSTEEWERVYTSEAASYGWNLNWKRATNHGVYRRVPAKRA